MTCEEVVKAAIGLGLTHVKTYGGWIPLSEWTPYGHKTGHVVNFRIEGDRIHEEPTNRTRTLNRTLSLGVWTLDAQKGDGL